MSKIPPAEMIARGAEAQGTPGSFRCDALLLKSSAMKIVARRIPFPLKDPRSWGLILGTTLLWVIAWAAVPSKAGVQIHGFGLPPCPFRILTGIRCPFCGITTGCAWMARGQWREAWSGNILSPVVMAGSLFFLGYAVFRLVFARDFHVEPAVGLRRIWWIALLAACAFSWLVNLRR